MPAVARQLAASPYLERDSSDEEDEDTGERKPRSGAGKPSQPVLRVGGRAVSRRGVQASRKATKKQPPKDRQGGTKAHAQCIAVSRLLVAPIRVLERECSPEPLVSPNVAMCVRGIDQSCEPS
jgi:hypothetical protein